MHTQEIEARMKHSFTLLEDEPSQLIYSSQVYYNITGDYSYIGQMLRNLFFAFPESISSDKIKKKLNAEQDSLNALRPLSTFSIDHDNMFFEPSLVHLKDGEVFIDAGAMDMSTCLEFAFQTKDTFQKIIAFEPDPICQEICQDNLSFFSKSKREDVKIMDFGLYDSDGKQPFERATVIGNSRIIDKGDETVPVKRLDDLEECRNATFLKIHTEGSEAHVIAGAENLIRNNHPIIAVSLYHNLEELLDVPMLIKHYYSGYKLFMRHYSTGTSESVLYAIPDNR